LSGGLCRSGEKHGRQPNTRDAPGREGREGVKLGPARPSHQGGGELSRTKNKKRKVERKESGAGRDEVLPPRGDFLGGGKRKTGMRKTEANDTKGSKAAVKLGRTRKNGLHE